MKAICKKDHRYDVKFEGLNESQADEGRHICAGCSYEQGYKDGIDGAAPRWRGDELPFSQAGKVRHKDAYEAYKLGHDEGVQKRREER